MKKIILIFFFMIFILTINVIGTPPTISPGMQKAFNEINKTDKKIIFFDIEDLLQDLKVGNGKIITFQAIVKNRKNTNLSYSLDLVNISSLEVKVNHSSYSSWLKLNTENIIIRPGSIGPIRPGGGTIHQVSLSIPHNVAYGRYRAIFHVIDNELVYPNDIYAEESLNIIIQKENIFQGIINWFKNLFKK